VGYLGKGRLEMLVGTMGSPGSPKHAKQKFGSSNFVTILVICLICFIPQAKSARDSVAVKCFNLHPIGRKYEK